MAELKREYVVPLRRKCLNAPKWRRSKKAIAVLKDFMRKHMKCENVIVCAELNEHIWANGAKNPPGIKPVTTTFLSYISRPRLLTYANKAALDVLYPTDPTAS